MPIEVTQVKIIKVYDGHVTPHFKLSEMMCNDGSPLPMTPEIIDHAQRMEKFRIWYNRPIIPTSWHRSPAHNQRVGGAKNSMHLKGIATDFPLPSDFQAFDIQRQQQFIDNIKTKWQSLGGGAMFYYPEKKFIHLDSRKTPFKYDEY